MLREVHAPTSQKTDKAHNTFVQTVRKCTRLHQLQTQGYVGLHYIPWAVEYRYIVCLCVYIYIYTYQSDLKPNIKIKNYE